MHDFAGNTVLVGERDAAKGVPHLLAKFSLNHVAGSVLIKLQWLAHVGQERAGDEVIALDGNAAAKRTLQDVRDRDTLQRAGVEMLDKRHVNVAGEERKFNCAQFVEAPALPAAARSDSLVPHRRHLLAQRLIFDLHQAGEKFRDFFDAVFHWLTTNAHRWTGIAESCWPK